MKDYSNYGAGYQGFVVEDGVYVPAPKDDFSGDDPFKKMAQVRGHVRDINFDGDYPYLDKSLRFRIHRYVYYRVLLLIVFVLNKLFYDVRIEGRENIRKNKKMLRDGAMTVCNHIGRWDMISVLQAIRYQRVWIPMYRLPFMGKDGYLMRLVGGIPVPEDLQGLRRFNEAFDELHEQKQWIHIFPESCSWKFYAPIRPFKIGAFNMAYKYNMPIIPTAISFRERKGIRKLFRKDEPLVTIRIGEPIMPDRSRPRREEANRLRQETHQAMLKLAGIVENPWPAAID